MSTAAVVLDGRFRVVALNPAAETLLETSARQTLGFPFARVARDEECLELAGRARAGRRACIERNMRLGRRLVDCTATPLGEDDGGGVLLEMADVEHYRRMSDEGRLLTQNESVEAVVRGLAHEMRNPLGGLRGAAQLLERELAARDAGRACRVHRDHRLGGGSAEPARRPAAHAGRARGARAGQPAPRHRARVRPRRGGSGGGSGSGGGVGGGGGDRPRLRSEHPAAPRELRPARAGGAERGEERRPGEGRPHRAPDPRRPPGPHRAPPASPRGAHRRDRQRAGGAAGPRRVGLLPNGERARGRLGARPSHRPVAREPPRRDHRARPRRWRDDVLHSPPVAGLPE